MWHSSPRMPCRPIRDGWRGCSMRSRLRRMWASPTGHTGPGRSSPMVARELTEWFQSFVPDGAPRIDHLELNARSRAPSWRAFADSSPTPTDAWLEQRRRVRAVSHGCVRRGPGPRCRRAQATGWREKISPAAAVIHSHDSLIGWLRRSFDEARAMQEVYGNREPAELRRNALVVWGQVGADLRWVRAHGGRRSPALIGRSVSHSRAENGGSAPRYRASALPNG